MSLWLAIRPYLSNTVRHLRISFLELKSAYQGTFIGLLWLPLSTLIFVMTLTFVFSHQGVMDHQRFFIYVLSGYITWSLISDSLGGSIDIIQKKLDFAIHSNLSLFGLFLKTLADRFVEWAINMVVLIGLALVFAPQEDLMHLFLLLPLALILALFSLSTSYIINIATVFIPDMAGVIRPFVRFVFFASPVFWVAAGSGNRFRDILTLYNPVSYYLDITRQAVGVFDFNIMTWSVAVGLSLVAALVSGIAYSLSRNFVRNIK